LRSIDPGDFTVLTAPDLLDRPGPAEWAEAEVEAPQRVPRSLLT
jgi:hypothetical protein